MTLTRRRFLTRAAAAGAAVGLPTLVARRAFGANERIAAVVVGLGFRGPGHIIELQAVDGVEVVGLCEPDRQRLAAHAAQFQQQHGRAVQQLVDYRDVVADPAVDVVTIASPQHWHPLMTIWACQAGKDVYVEKPTSHYVWEGRQMVNAARKYRRIVQAGTQYRSVACVAQMAQFLDEGGLGEIQFAALSGNKTRRPLGLRSQPLTIPEHVDYDLWCGPAERRELYRVQLHYDWNFDFNTGDGDSCNYSIHHMDVVRWLLRETYPRRVMSMGGRFNWADAGDVPNSQVSYYDFARAPVFYMLRNLPAAKTRDRFTLHVHGEHGVLEIPGARGRVEAGTAYDHQRNVIRQFSGGVGAHMVNFIEAVRSRNAEDLNAEVLEGHISTAATHLANISWRVGTKMSTDDATRHVPSDVRGAAVFQRAFVGDMIKYLHGNVVDLSGESMTVGPWLEFDADAEQFVDHAEANRLIRGRDRAPFTVPEVTV